MLDLDVAAAATIDEVGIRVSGVGADGIRFEPLTRRPPAARLARQARRQVPRPQRRRLGARAARPRPRRGRAREAALPPRRERRPGRIALLARPRRRRARLALHARAGAHVGRRTTSRRTSTASSRSSSATARRPRSSTSSGSRRRSWLFASCHARVERDAELDWVEGGFGSSRGQGLDPERPRRPRRHLARHRRVLRRRVAAPRLRHVPAARGAGHDLRLRVQGRAPRHGGDRLARDDPRRGRRAEDERLPGEPQPPPLEDRDRELDPRASRSSRTTCAAPTGRRSRRSTASSSST